ncbi:GlxA family transcriptional regulator [Agrobacterium vitis]|uniref:GlxA family transcriptional regulator n=1 Tax=Agrobacterium vitis TaxID=373 RepID=A0AAE2RJ07_AGRVI|nr:GlxA family transcriptional regulator [Agrobacterium vitis]MBF2717705.1 GlxA family transcriptional regulator [Agrobacterium vitis]MVA22728.1 helix-turn-helix domain-containing protein [Agrobacterium vitis]
MLRKIEILVFPDAQVLDATGPAQVFASANQLSRASTKGPLYEIALVAEEAEVTCNSGITLRCQTLSARNPGPDTAIVAGGSGVNAACSRPALIEWVQDRATNVRRLASVCSGAFLLAQAGLLNGRRAVTHWHRCDEFAKRFPDVRLERDPIFLRDDPIWTSAGVTAGIDLALAMVEEDHGRVLALAVARELVVFLKRPGGQSQFSAPLMLQSVDDRFSELHAWISANLSRQLTLETLADQTGMSLRSFVRHYRQRTGRTPAEAVETIRLERAQGLLETGAAISTTARKCGFGSPETMRRAFLRKLGVGPKEWQDRFRS